MSGSASRRAFLRGQVAGTVDIAVRPPWALAESAFTTKCTRCGDCAPACPEAIIVTGDGGFPIVDFQRGACSFCGECAAACATGALACTEPAVPWSLNVEIDPDRCLATRGIACRVCGDQCEPRAIRFTPGLRGTARIDIDPSDCTGCGACAGPCPVGAVTITPAPAIGRPS